MPSTARKNATTERVHRFSVGVGGTAGPYRSAPAPSAPAASEQISEPTPGDGADQRTPPQADAAALGVELVAQHAAPCTWLGSMTRSRAYPLREQLVFEPRLSNVDVRQVAAVDVVRLDVVLETHEPAEEPRGRVVGGFRPEALQRLGRMMRLRGVDAQ